MTHSFLKRNGLLLTFFSLTIITLFFQSYYGWRVDSAERLENGLAVHSYWAYLQSGHFIQATFENWESEFLQMALYVMMTIFLYQQGSSESKKLEGKEAVDREPVAHPGAPWPVRRGGLVLVIYKNSLSLAFILLFLISFFLHAFGTMQQLNEEGASLNLITVFAEDRFWFESFQNWQSEFLSVASIVFLSIYLRQKGSPESKPVDAPNSETGG